MHPPLIRSDNALSFTIETRLPGAGSLVVRPLLHLDSPRQTSKARFHLRIQPGTNDWLHI